jgi:hypothetical protein
MPLMLDNMRAEFARKLADDPAARFSMDKALGHVITIAYERGLDDGRRDTGPNLIWKRGGKAHVWKTYARLHEGKIGQHWLWAAIERIALAGESEAEVMADFGYEKVDAGGTAVQGELLTANAKVSGDGAFPPSA